MSWGKKTTPPSSSGGSTTISCTTTPYFAHPALKARIVEIKGLYKPGLDDRAIRPSGTTKNSGYQAGYISSDNKGRIFTNRILDGSWSKDKQFIEIAVQVDVIPSGCALPAGTKVKWCIEDPDDPTNNDPDFVEHSGKVTSRARDELAVRTISTEWAPAIHDQRARYVRALGYTFCHG